MLPCLCLAVFVFRTLFSCVTSCHVCRILQFRAKVALAELQVGHKQKGAYLIGQLLQRYPGYPEMLLAAAAVSLVTLILQSMSLFATDRL